MTRTGYAACAAALLAASLLGCAESGGSDASDASDATTRAAMQEIAAALRVALPASLSEARWESPENREQILGALRTLAERSTGLEVHGRQRDASFGYLSRSLARDAREVRWRFEAGRLAESRFLLGSMVDDCIACHSRLPDPHDSDLGEELLSEVDVERLEPVERMRLQLATRQFDEALDTAEAIFRGPLEEPIAFDLDALIREYLVVALRSDSDPDRPRKALRELAARPDVAPPLRADLQSWIAAMDAIEKQPPQGSDLEQGRALLAEAQRRTSVPADRGGLVHDVVGSSHLYRYVDSAPPPSAEVAEAYYLLGVADARIGPSFGLSESDFYLETAIRMAPGSDIARRAFRLLEEQTVFEYSGSSGENVPDHLQAHLEQLRRVAGAP